MVDGWVLSGQVGEVLWMRVGGGWLWHGEFELYLRFEWME